MDIQAPRSRRTQRGAKI